MSKDNLKGLYNKYSAKNRSELINKIVSSNYKNSGKQKDLRTVNRESKNMPKIHEKTSSYLTEINQKVKIEANLRNNLKAYAGTKTIAETKHVLKQRETITVKNPGFHEYQRQSKAIDVFKDKSNLGDYKDRYHNTVGKYAENEMEKKHEHYIDVKLNKRVERDYNSSKDQSTDRITIGLSKSQLNELNRLGQTNRAKAMDFLNTMVRNKFSVGISGGGGSPIRFKDGGTIDDLEVDSLIGLYQ